MNHGDDYEKIWSYYRNTWRWGRDSCISVSLCISRSSSFFPCSLPSFLPSAAIRAKTRWMMTAAAAAAEAGQQLADDFRYRWKLSPFIVRTRSSIDGNCEVGRKEGREMRRRRQGGMEAGREGSRGKWRLSDQWRLWAKRPHKPVYMEHIDVAANLYTAAAQVSCSTPPPQSDVFSWGIEPTLSTPATT